MDLYQNKSFLYLKRVNQDEIEEIINNHYEAFILEPSHPCFEASENTVWSFEPLFTELLVSEYHQNNLNKVLSWWEEEIARNKLEGDDPKYYQKLEKTYLANYENMPIIALEGKDGSYYINDGHHRYAIALKNELSPIYCLVGRVNK